MAWTEPKFSGTRRTKAGIALAKGVTTDEDLEVIDNWRSSHSQPLQTIKMMLKGRAKNVDEKAVVAQRLKRLPSIRAKLQRETLRLQQMQDLGGCRAIMTNMEAVKELVRIFKEGIEKNPKLPGLKRHELVDEKDYIANPKADGYRSIHYVYAYRTNTAHLACFDGHLIEIQIRTQLQHAWATAVEIVDTFTGQSLKSALKTQIGDPNWRRFFICMSAELAFRERTTHVPGTTKSRADVRKEIRALSILTDVEAVLEGLGAAVKLIGDAPDKDAAAYVLELNARDRSVYVSSFSHRDLEKAKTHFFEVEKKYADSPFIQVVQVSVERMEALQTAFPNYYLDTTRFIRVLRQILD